MTEKITLELTLKELQMIDKYVELNDDTQQLFDKIRNAYPVCRSCIEEAYKEWCGEYPSGTPSEDVRWDAFLNGYQATQPKAIPVEEPTKPRSPLDEIVDRMVKEHQAQKLYNRLYDELSYDFESCEDIVSLVEDWILDEQSSAGSQNVNTELLVEGFNDAIRKMKEMLR